MQEFNYQKIIKVIEAELKEFEHELVKDIVYPDETLLSLIKAPAKRIRPVLGILLLKMFGEKPNKQIYTLLSAVELAHTASLIHDDIVDFDSKRRGIETISSKFGDKIGVLTGDYLLSCALKKITILNEISITQDFLKTFSDMAQGEINQFFSRGKILSLDEYIEKTEAKTAGLFRSALVNTAKIAGLDIKTATEIGENFGIAFQIKNDLDNVLGSNTDLKSGVYTAPVIFSTDTKITPEGIYKTKILISQYCENVQKALANCPFNEYNKAMGEIIQCLIN